VSPSCPPPAGPGSSQATEPAGRGQLSCSLRPPNRTATDSHCQAPSHRLKSSRPAAQGGGVWGGHEWRNLRWPPGVGGSEEDGGAGNLPRITNTPERGRRGQHRAAAGIDEQHIDATCLCLHALVARPIPVVPPVTTAIFPSSLRTMICLPKWVVPWGQIYGGVLFFKIEMNENHRCRIVDVQATGFRRARDVR
jgi:hypothetical protein